MAWIVKDSAHAAVERRPQPYLTEEMKQHMATELLPRYATKQAALLPVLHKLQHKIGWLPGQALEEAAAFLGLSPAEVLDTATFYEEYFLKPKGEHLIQVCRSIACELCGYKDLRDKLQAKLGILPGETTDDGKITLMEVECLGACDFAPCALVDHHLHETLSFEKLSKVVDGLK
jgi:NADH-quinone oxidoreductase subunit E